MRLGMISLLAGTICLMAGAPASAKYYGREKWEVTPFVGYETSGSYPLSSSTVTVNALRINGAASFGTFIGYSLTPNSSLSFFGTAIRLPTACRLKAVLTRKPTIRTWTNFNSA